MHHVPLGYATVASVYSGVIIAKHLESLPAAVHLMNIVVYGLRNEGWLVWWYICHVHRGSNCTQWRGMDGRIMRHSCQSDATLEIVKRWWLWVYSRVDSKPAALRNLRSGSWLAWAAHYTAIHSNFSKVPTVELHRVGVGGVYWALKVKRCSFFVYTPQSYGASLAIMGLHSVICHPIQVNAPRLSPSHMDGTRLIYPGR